MKKLSKKQKGVVKGAFTGMVLSLIVIVMAVIFPFFPNIKNKSEALCLAFAFSSLLALTLMICIGRIANYRFASPKDIDGSGLTNASEHIKILQALLQNTLEQCVFSLLVYLTFAVTMPIGFLSVIPACAVTFFVGRVLFFTGYKKGAANRALGFALSFYPSVFMFVMVFIHLIYNMINIIN